MEGTRSKSNSKKSGTKQSTNSNRAVYNAVCCAQSNDGQTYIGVEKLNGQPVKVLQDTGCTGMIVDRALVLDVMVIPGSSGSLQMVDYTLIDVHWQMFTWISLLQRTLQGDVCELPLYPVITGNV